MSVPSQCAELGALGYAHVSYPATLMFRAAATMAATLAALRRHAEGEAPMTQDGGAGAARALLDEALDVARWQALDKLR